MRELITVPNAILRKPCEPIKKVTGSIRSLAAEMLAYLASLNTSRIKAYGLAAPQYGESIQLFVISTPSVQLVALNPVVIKFYGVHNWVEGCLSLPGQLYLVSRPKLIKFQYVSLDGERHAAKFHDDFAGICTHEIDHLSGRLIDSIGRPVSGSSIFQDSNCASPPKGSPGSVSTWPFPVH